MSIMLGNQSIEQIENRTGIKFPDKIKEYMEENHQHSASNIQKGKWHCFDIPFVLECGDYETAKRIYESVKEKSSEVKEALQIAVQGGS